MNSVGYFRYVVYACDGTGESFFEHQVLALDVPPPVFPREGEQLLLDNVPGAVMKHFGLVHSGHLRLEVDSVIHQYMVTGGGKPGLVVSVYARKFRGD